MLKRQEALYYAHNDILSQAILRCAGYILIGGCDIDAHESTFCYTSLLDEAFGLQVENWRDEYMQHQARRANMRTCCGYSCGRDFSLRRSSLL